MWRRARRGPGPRFVARTPSAAGAMAPAPLDARVGRVGLGRAVDDGDLRLSEDPGRRRVARRDRAQRRPRPRERAEHRWGRCPAVESGHRHGLSHGRGLELARPPQSDITGPPASRMPGGSPASHAATAGSSQAARGALYGYRPLVLASVDALDDPAPHRVSGPRNPSGSLGLGRRRARGSWRRRWASCSSHRPPCPSPAAPPPALDGANPRRLALRHRP